ncbi:MAG: murein L,D-transpeptidase, partial [Moraxellaceae bacterium]
ETNQSTSAASKSPKNWTLDNLNNATWSSDLGKGQFVEYAKIQVLLNRFHSSPGVIDGINGMNMIKAISSFQVMNNLTASGEMDAPTWTALTQATNNDVFQSYTITKQDIDGPYVSSIPSDYADQAKMKSLGYVRVTEMLAERFHMDENFLKQLNPEATFSKAGETLIVANPRQETTTPVSLIIAHKGAKHVYAFDANNKMIAAFPATIGSSDTPSPKGTYQVKAIAPNPWYGYNPKNFVQGKNMKPLSLPPGPNNPVGNMWIALSKPSFGIHGTPNPSLISKTASHGCIRLTNWDATTLSKQVQKGVTVKFLE